jgi:hypothetical protein
MGTEKFATRIVWGQKVQKHFAEIFAAKNWSFIIFKPLTRQINKLWDATLNFLHEGIAISCNPS